MLSEDALGNCSVLKLSGYTLHFLTLEPYFFMAGTANPVICLFLPLLLNKLKQITLLVIGPKTDVNRLFVYYFLFL